MDDSIKRLLAHVSQSIKALQDFQGNSSTPLEAAIAAMVTMRRLDKCRDALREGVFKIAEDDPVYLAAVEQLKNVTARAAKELKTHEAHMQVVTAAAQAVEAVLKVAIAVGAMVVGI